MKAKINMGACSDMNYENLNDALRAAEGFFRFGKPGIEIMVSSEMAAGWRCVEVLKSGASMKFKGTNPVLTGEIWYSDKECIRKLETIKTILASDPWVFDIYVEEDLVKVAVRWILRSFNDFDAFMERVEDEADKLSLEVSFHKMGVTDES